MTDQQLFSRINISVLSGTANPADVEQACTLAAAHGCCGVLVSPCFIALCAKNLAGTDLRCTATASYPLGTDLLAVTLYAAQQSILAGCDEILLALNVGKILSGDSDTLAREIQLVYASIDAALGVLINTAQLSHRQLGEVARLAVESGAACIVLAAPDLRDAPQLIQNVKDATGQLANIRIHSPFESRSAMEGVLSSGADGLIADVSEAKNLLG